MLTFIVHCYFLLSPGISFIYVLARVCPISRYPSRHILFFLHFVAFQIFLPRGLNVRFIFLLLFFFMCVLCMLRILALFHTHLHILISNMLLCIFTSFVNLSIFTILHLLYVCISHVSFQHAFPSVLSFLGVAIVSM
jgi:hypothetical protein